MGIFYVQDTYIRRLLLSLMDIKEFLVLKINKIKENNFHFGDWHVHKSDFFTLHKLEILT